MGLGLQPRPVSKPSQLPLQAAASSSNNARSSNSVSSLASIMAKYQRLEEGASRSIAGGSVQQAQDAAGAGAGSGNGTSAAVARLRAGIAAQNDTLRVAGSLAGGAGGGRGR